MKETKKRNCGFGKVLLGIVIATASMIAYKKVPVIKNVVDNGVNACKNGLGKVGEALAKAGNKQQTPKGSE